MTKKNDPAESDDINVNEDEAESESVYPPDSASLMERILWIRDRVTRLGKDSSVQAGQGHYNAISHDKVTGFIRPKMVQAGIVHYIIGSESTDSETGAVTAKGRKIMQHRAKFIVRFVNVHDKLDFIEIPQAAHADDYGDKGPGKATSYAMKYVLLKMFMIETGEEDEERVTGEADGGRVAVIIDDENLLMELYAVAEECFGDDASAMLKAMAERRFHVDSYGEIPQDRMSDAVKSLRVKAASMTEPKKESDSEQKT